MTLISLLNEQQALSGLLVSVLDRNQRYVAAFGYPSGRACPYCGKEAFATAQELERLAAAPPDSNLAHDWCHEIASLKETLVRVEAELVGVQHKISLVPKPTESKPEEEQAC